jgi:hypothetical protein
VRRVRTAAFNTLHSDGDEILSVMVRALTGANGWLAIDGGKISSATKEQIRQYFEVRFRTEKYGVPYFFGVSEATHGKRPQEQERVAVEDLNGGDLRADAGRRPFKPQTALLR